MSTVTSADGTTISYDLLGSGPPVILIAGATCTRGVKAPLASALADHCQVINYDRRGRGESDDLSTPPPYDVEREVEDLVALIDSIGGHASLYGHSSGAALALHATASGIGVDRLVMHDVPYSPPGSDGQRARDWDAHLHGLLSEGRPGDAVADFMQMVGMPGEMIDNMKQSPMWPAMEAVGPTLAYDSAAMGDRAGGFIPADLVASADVPALVLVGGADYGFMIDVAKALVESLPQARLEHLVGAGHDAGPELYAPQLAAFLGA